MDFNDILMDLEIATEAISGEAHKDYKAVAKAAKEATRAARKAMKAGNYDEAIKYCDDAIASINAFKAQLAESRRGDERGEEGEGEGAEPKGAGIAKAIVKSVLAALAAAAVVGVANKASGKVTAKQSAKAQSAIDKRNTLNRQLAVDTEDRKNINEAKGKLQKDYEKHNANARVAHNVNEKMTAKTAGIAGGAALVGAGVVQALSAFIKGKTQSEEAIVKALDAAVKSLEAVKSACNEARRGATEAANASIEEFFDGVFEAMFADANESFVMDFVEAGMDDLMACEMYVDFIVPNM